MQLRSEDRAAFLKRMLVSTGMFLLLLSVGANIFFLLTRKTPSRVVTVTNPYVPVSHALNPRSFGSVVRGVPVKPQKTSGTSALLPVGTYTVPAAALPNLPEDLPLYRNQGIVVDDGEIARVFGELGVTVPWRELQVLPLMQRWRSADRTMDITLDVEKRALTVSRLGSFTSAPEGPADNPLTIALGKEFAESMGIDLTTVGTPQIVERTSDGQTKTYVVWPMMFGDAPLIDTDARPVPAVQVQVGRLSRKALSMTVTLLQPDRLTSSDYPRASADVLSKGFLDGGFLPIAKDLKGKKTDATFTDFSLVYVLLPGDSEYPLYIFPAVKGVYVQGNVAGVTYVPAIDPTHFSWYQK